MPCTTYHATPRIAKLPNHRLLNMTSNSPIHCRFQLDVVHSLLLCYQPGTNFPVHPTQRHRSEADGLFKECYDSPPSPGCCLWSRFQPDMFISSSTMLATPLDSNRNLENIIIISDVRCLYAKLSALFFSKNYNPQHMPYRLFPLLLPAYPRPLSSPLFFPTQLGTSLHY